MKEKISGFSVKMVAKIFGKDNILVNEVKFANMVEGSDISEAFKNVQERIREKARQRGYPLRKKWKNGYRVQYHINGSFKKLWEKTAPLN